MCPRRLVGPADLRALGVEVPPGVSSILQYHPTAQSLVNRPMPRI